MPAREKKVNEMSVFGISIRSASLIATKRRMRWPFTCRSSDGIKLDDPIKAVRIIKLKPNACVVQIISVDLKVISIIRTDAYTAPR